MPQAVAAAIFKAFVVESWKALIVKALIYSAVTFALNKVITALTPRPKTGETRGIEASVVDSSADGRILYGEVRSSGINVIPPWTSGTDNRYLHQILAVAVHEVDSFSDVYFDQDTITDAMISTVSGNADDGKVTSGKYRNAAWIRRYVGTASQTVDFILNTSFPATWSVDARGRGIAYVALQYDYGDGKVYTGIPQVTFTLRGKKCYDPRLDTSPGANPTNTSYIAWTDNPALCWADYKMATYGRNVAASEIDWPSVVTAADECDELVAVPTSTTQKRYTCNGLLLANNDPNDNEKKLLDAMMGRMVYLRGKWTVYAGSWQAPSTSIDKTDWESLGAIQTTASRDGGRYNGVRVYHVDPARNWQRVESYPRFSDTFRTADNNERIWIEMEQPMCTSAFEAQRKAEILLRASRNGVRISGTLPPRFMLLAPWDVVAVTFDELGWQNKTFRIITTTPNPDGSIEVALVEEQDTDWDDLAEGDYNNPSVAALPVANPTVPTAPRNFTVLPQPGQLRFDWDDPVVKPEGTRYRVLAGVSSYTDPASRTVIFDGLVTNALYPYLSTQTPQFYYAQAYAGSYFSEYTPTTYGVSAIPLFGGVEQRQRETTWVSTGWTGINSTTVGSLFLYFSGFHARGGEIRVQYGYEAVSSHAVTWTDISSWLTVTSAGNITGPRAATQLLRLWRRVNSGTWFIQGDVGSPGNYGHEIPVWFGVRNYFPGSGSANRDMSFYVQAGRPPGDARDDTKQPTVLEFVQKDTVTSAFYEFALWPIVGGVPPAGNAYSNNTAKTLTNSSAFMFLDGNGMISHFFPPLDTQAVLRERLFGTVSETLGLPADAPVDNVEYVRKNGAWMAIAGSGAGITDAPSDGNLYGRKNSTWEIVPSSGGGGGGGGGTSKVLVQSSWLGSQAAQQGTFTYANVSSVCARGLSSRLLIGATVGQPLFDIEVRNAANSSGDLFLRAIGITERQYEASIPFYYETNSGASMYVGIRNRAANASSFNLNMLRLEKFA